MTADQLTELEATAALIGTQPDHLTEDDLEQTQPGTAKRCQHYCGCTELLIEPGTCCINCQHGNCPMINDEQRAKLQELWLNEQYRIRRFYAEHTLESKLAGPYMPAFLGRNMLYWMMRKTLDRALQLARILNAQLLRAHPALRQYEQQYLNMVGVAFDTLTYPEMAYRDLYIGERAARIAYGIDEIPAAVSDDDAPELI